MATVDAIRCFTGFKIVRGQSFGGEEFECKDDNEYCYNVTAEAGVLIKAAKAGCSYYRCLLSRNKCVNTVISGVPVSFCCCNTEDLCNGQ
uniref:Activin_recp domain-containing protein n=1 Tax=Globodera rostochiensis TaxID=31243 RepID=A0A914HN33_GLORO